ncbi:hypothetical protein QQ045_030927 [Rhodiola kirilowii]
MSSSFERPNWISDLNACFDSPRTRDNANNNDQAFSQSQHHPSNWVEADDDDDGGDDNELCVQSTPPYFVDQYGRLGNQVRDVMQEIQQQNQELCQVVAKLARSLRGGTGYDLRAHVDEHEDLGD